MTPVPGWSSVPPSFVSFFVFYIFSYLLSKTMGCFSGCLMSSAGLQKLFGGIYLAFKCSFDEYVGEKVFSPSYSSAILAPPLFSSLAHFLIGSFIFLELSCMSCSYIFEINCQLLRLLLFFPILKAVFSPCL